MTIRDETRAAARPYAAAFVQPRSSPTSSDSASGSVSDSHSDANKSSSRSPNSPAQPSGRDLVRGDSIRRDLIGGDTEEDGGGDERKGNLSLHQKISLFKDNLLHAFQQSFYDLGGVIFDRPFAFMAGSLIVAGLCAISFLFITFETRADLLYALPASRARSDLAKQAALFDKPPRINMVFVVSKDGDKILTSSVLRKLKKLDHYIKHDLHAPTSKRGAGGGFTFEDVCYRMTLPSVDFSAVSGVPALPAPTAHTPHTDPGSGSSPHPHAATTADAVEPAPCYSMTALDLYRSDRQFGMPLATRQWPYVPNVVSNKITKADLMLANPEFVRLPSGTTKLTNATGFLMLYQTNAEDLVALERSLAWEQSLVYFINNHVRRHATATPTVQVKALTAGLSHFKAPEGVHGEALEGTLEGQGQGHGNESPDFSVSDWEGFKVFVNAARSWQDELGRSTSLDARLMRDYLMAYTIIATYMILMNRTNNLIRSKAVCGFVGSVSALLGFAFGGGICYWLGLQHTPTMHASPFLVLAIGLDNTFVVLNFYTLAFNHVDKPRKRCCMALCDSGVSLTITTSTSIISFLVGAFGPYLAVRNFCLITAMGLLGGFLFNITFFFPMLCLEAVAESENRILFLPQALTPAWVHKSIARRMAMEDRNGAGLNQRPKQSSQEMAVEGQTGTTSSPAAVNRDGQDHRVHGPSGIGMPAPDDGAHLNFFRNSSNLDSTADTALQAVPGAHGHTDSHTRGHTPRHAPGNTHAEGRLDPFQSPAVARSGGRHWLPTPVAAAIKNRVNASGGGRSNDHSGSRSFESCESGERARQELSEGILPYHETLRRQGLGPAYTQDESQEDTQEDTQGDTQEDTQGDSQEDTQGDAQDELQSFRNAFDPIERGRVLERGSTRVTNDSLAQHTNASTLNLRVRAAVYETQYRWVEAHTLRNRSQFELASIQWRFRKRALDLKKELRARSLAVPARKAPLVPDKKLLALMEQSHHIHSHTHTHQTQDHQTRDHHGSRAPRKLVNGPGGLDVLETPCDQLPSPMLAPLYKLSSLVARVTEEPKGNNGKASRSFFLNILGPLFSTRPLQIVACAIIAAYVGFSLTGAIKHLSAGLDLENLTPPDSYLREAFEMSHSMFPIFPYETNVVFTAIDRDILAKAREAYQPPRSPNKGADATPDATPDASGDADGDARGNVFLSGATNPSEGMNSTESETSLAGGLFDSLSTFSAFSFPASPSPADNAHHTPQSARKAIAAFVSNSYGARTKADYKVSHSVDDIANYAGSSQNTGAGLDKWKATLGEIEWWRPETAAGLFRLDDNIRKLDTTQDVLNGMLLFYTDNAAKLFPLEGEVEGEGGEGEGEEGEGEVGEGKKRANDKDDVSGRARFHRLLYKWLSSGVVGRHVRNQFHFEEPSPKDPLHLPRLLGFKLAVFHFNFLNSYEQSQYMVEIRKMTDEASLDLSPYLRSPLAHTAYLRYKQKLCEQEHGTGSDCETKAGEESAEEEVVGMMAPKVPPPNAAKDLRDFLATYSRTQSSQVTQSSPASQVSPVTQSSLESAPSNQRALGSSRGSGFTATPFLETFLFFESDITILYSTIVNMSTAFIAIIIVSSMLMRGVASAAIVSLTICSVDIGIIGAMGYWGIHLNVLSMILLVLSIGFSVDYTVHVVHTFSHALGTSRRARTVETLILMCNPVTHGAISTILGILPIYFRKEFILETFFKMTLLVVAFGFLNGVIFLPIILSICGPSIKETKTKSRLLRHRLNEDLQPLLYQPASLLMDDLNGCKPHHSHELTHKIKPY